MTTADIQQVSLEILKDVHSFCIKNDIRYSLSYGTLLGAIRHKGFIPWDDDLDIMMPRPDYERFIQSYQSTNGYKILPEGKDSMIAMARVYEDKKTRVLMPVSPWCKNKEVGVWIDIFPMDGAENDFNSFISRLDKVYNLWRENISYRKSQIPFNLSKGIIENIRLLKRKIICLRNNKNSEMIKLIKSVEYGSTDYVTSLAVPEIKIKEHYPISYFKNYVEVEFEDSRFLSILEYKKYLNYVYGNYMQLPPIENRKPTHSFNTYYWK